jgi:hypothetical protein
MKYEQRFFIKIESEYFHPTAEISRDLKAKYGQPAYSRGQVSTWVNYFKMGRKNFFDLPRPGRTPDEVIPRAFDRVIGKDRYFSAKAVPHTLRLALGAVFHYLRHYFRMSYQLLKWVTHMLSDAQKAKRVDLAGSMLATLSHQVSSNFHFIFTGDESWFFYSYPHTHQWVVSMDDRAERERESHFKEKRIFTGFFNGTGEFLIDIMPAGETMTGQYFAQHIIVPLVSVCYPNGRIPHQHHVNVHFDNATIHGTLFVNKSLSESQLLKMAHPPYSSDLAPRDFFLFGYVKEKIQRMVFSDPEELLTTVEGIIKGVSFEIRMTGFNGGMRRLQGCIDLGGEYQEQRPSTLLHFPFPLQLGMYEVWVNNDHPVNIVNR